MNRMLIERRFDTGEVELNYVEGPNNGPPFLYIHGITGYGKAIDLFYPYLSHNWHLYSPDLRGHGQSSRSTDYSVKASVNDMVKLIDEVIKEPPVIYGHSFGGMVGTMIAGMHPDKVRALIIGDTPGNVDHSIRGFFKMSKGNWSDMRNQIRSGEYGRDWSYRYRYTDPEALTPWAECGEDDEVYNSFLNGYDTGMLFSKIICPVLLMRSDPKVSSLMSDTDVESAGNLIHDYSYVMVEGVGHNTFTEAEKTYTAMVPFLFSL